RASRRQPRYAYARRARAQDTALPHPRHRDAPPPAKDPLCSARPAAEAPSAPALRSPLRAKEARILKSLSRLIFSSHFPRSISIHIAEIKKSTLPCSLRPTKLSLCGKSAATGARQNEKHRSVFRLAEGRARVREPPRHARIRRHPRSAAATLKVSPCFMRRRKRRIACAFTEECLSSPFWRRVRRSALHSSRNVCFCFGSG